jgi:hypothetical protein
MVDRQLTSTLPLTIDIGKIVWQDKFAPAGYHPNVSIPGSTLNFVWIMVAHYEVIDRKWGVVQVDLRYG